MNEKELIAKLEEMEKYYEENDTLKSNGDVEFVLKLSKDYDMTLYDYLGEDDYEGEDEICNGELILISRRWYYLNNILKDLIEKIKKYGVYLK